MSDEFEDEIDHRTGLELWLSDLSTDSATRNMGAFLIALGSLLGVIVGIMLISGNVSDILSGELDDSGGKADVNGLVITELVDNTTGGDHVEGVTVKVFDDLGIEIGSDITDSGGRFSISDLPRRSSTLEVAHPGNVTVRILIIPGDYSQISITLVQGEGTKNSDIRGDSHLGESVFWSSWFGRCSRGEKGVELQENLVVILRWTLEQGDDVHRPTLDTSRNGPHKPLQESILRRIFQGRVRECI